MSDKDGSGFVAGVVIGSAIGFILGIMFAPAKGEETQKLVYEKSLEYGKEAKKIAGQIASRVKEEIDKRMPEKKVPETDTELH